MATETNEPVYRCLVVDSGPIIRLTGISSLWKKAKSFYTVPAVIQEIRDAKARQHLESLPFEIQAREPSPEAIKVIIDFARQTGDYQSLSSVDVQVLALVYDLEKEGCGGDVSHVRNVPKRMLGVGKVEMLGGKGEAHKADPSLEIVDDGDDDDDDEDDSDDEEDGDHSDSDHETEQIEKRQDLEEGEQASLPKKPVAPKSWAALLNPSVSLSPPRESVPSEALLGTSGNPEATESNHGQFSDAEEEDEKDEEKEETTEANQSHSNQQNKTLEEELQLEFPSLSAAVTVPYDGSDTEDNDVVDEEERKRRSLQPISKSGKLYTSVPVVKMLAKRRMNTPMKTVESGTVKAVQDNLQDLSINPAETVETSDNTKPRNNQSRIMGGMTMSGQQADVEDDGEGWITTSGDIQSLKALGALDPIKGKNGTKGLETSSAQLAGPAPEERTACTTTDFAMQNVLLQMNLELLSVDGMKIKKLKSWVRRCGACFKVYTNTEDTGPLTGKRLFCERCGSDMIQRIACSVDGKTGRLRLHLKKNYRHNLRGTKFALPKPSSGDRFQGDLLLREDQLLTGVWNQKAKMRGGGKAKAASESIFGRDIAKNVGCHVDSLTGDDIQVGFGRRNPNASKGRERRGKKKKSSTRACGLRRY